MVKAVTTCTSSTRPGNPAHGEVVFETDTNKMLIADLTEPGGGLWYAYNSISSFDAVTPPDDPDEGGLSINLWNLAPGEFTETHMDQIDAAVEYVESMILNNMNLTVKLSAYGHSSYDDLDPGKVSDGLGGNLGSAGVQYLIQGGLTKEWLPEPGTTHTFARPTISYMAFDPADLGTGGVLNELAGDRYDGHTALKIYWAAIHELLHCLGLGIFWDNTQLAGHSANSYQYDLTRGMTICATGAYYWGAYGNMEYRKACGFGGHENPDASEMHDYNGDLVKVLGAARIPLSYDRKHFLSSNSHLAKQYNDHNEFGQDIYHTPPWLVEGRILRMPKREIFTGALYNHISDTRSVVSPVTFGCLEDIGYTVDYSVADTTLSVVPLGSVPAWRNWDGGTPNQENNDCQSCLDGWPHVSDCAAPPEDPHWYTDGGSFGFF